MVGLSCDRRYHHLYQIHLGLVKAMFSCDRVQLVVESVESIGTLILGQLVLRRFNFHYQSVLDSRVVDAGVCDEALDVV